MRIMSKCHPNKVSVSRGLCANCFARKWRKEHPEQIRKTQQKNYQKRLQWMRDKEPNYRRNSWLRAKYDITLVEYEKILESQNGVCALCGRDNGNKPLNVDHDHKTGEVRGLLCLSCNQALGKFGDNKEGLLKVVAYLDGEYKFSKEI